MPSKQPLVVSGDYLFCAEPPPLEEVLAYVDCQVSHQHDVRLVFNEDAWSDRYGWSFDAVVESVKAHVRARGYCKTYQFWTTHVLYADAALIKGRLTQEGPPTGCHCSAFWEFETEQDAPKCELPAPRENAFKYEPPEFCLVCFEVPPDTRVMPCEHVVCCKRCSDVLKTSRHATVCILCRNPIESVLD